MRSPHVAQLMVHEQEMFGTEAWSEHGYRQELADREHRRYVVAVEGEQLLGWAGVLLLGDSAEVVTVGVVPTARRRGVARLLLADLLGYARDRGAAEVFLEVRVDNEPAITLYRSCGFEPVGRRRGYYQDGRVDATVMRLQLVGEQVALNHWHSPR